MKAQILFYSKSPLNELSENFIGEYNPSESLITYKDEDEVVSVKFNNGIVEILSEKRNMVFNTNRIIDGWIITEHGKLIMPIQTQSINITDNEVKVSYNIYNNMMIVSFKWTVIE